jgi:hypothetical protein
LKKRLHTTLSRLKPQSAKAKGRKLQQKVRDELIARLNLQADDVKSTSMGAAGEDVQLSPFARLRFPHSIECKARAKIAVYEWYKQAKENAGGHSPIVVIKQDRSDPLVVISLEDFMKLYERNMLDIEKIN